MPNPPDWLRDTPYPEPPPFTADIATHFALRIGLALAMGLVVAVLYYGTLGRRKGDSAAAMPLTLVLLAILVCMVTLIVNGSVALAFTLGGTLAIVRFRTVVDDTRDTAFVIAAVVVGMGMGTGSTAVIYLGLPVFALVVLAAFFVMPQAVPMHKIIVRLAPDRDPGEVTAGPFAALPNVPTLLGLETAKQGTAVEAVYSVKKLDSPTILKLLASFRGVEGVQGVEVKPM
jgi:hypothetical protein